MDSNRKIFGRPSVLVEASDRSAVIAAEDIPRISARRLALTALIGLTLISMAFSVPLAASSNEPSLGDESLHFCKRIVGPDTVCTFTEESWKNIIHMHAMGHVTDIYVKDVVPAEFDVEVVRYTHGEVLVTDLGQGEMGATMIEWWIDELQTDEQAHLVFKATTRLNPACHQEFTSPGTYAVNPGYDIRWTFEGETFEAESGERTVEAIDCGPGE